MPTQTFTSFEAHLAAVQIAGRTRATLAGKDTSPWTMSSLTLPKLKAQWGQAGAGNIIEGTVIPRGVSIYMPFQDAHLVKVNGQRFDSQTLRLQRPDNEYCLSSTGSHGWFALHIPNEVIDDWNATHASTIGSSSEFIRLTPNRAEMFRRAVENLGMIVDMAPFALESSAAIIATSRKFEALVRGALCGNAATTHRLPRHLISRRQIVQAVKNYIDQHNGEYISVAELSAVAGISERTLRAAFQDYFGFGPVRYLKLRVLNLAHKELQNADSSLTTVTQVATQFGIWELGRFALDYRLLFGELPSETLRLHRSNWDGRKSVVLHQS